MLALNNILNEQNIPSSKHANVTPLHKVSTVDDIENDPRLISLSFVLSKVAELLLCMNM